MLIFVLSILVIGGAIGGFIAMGELKPKPKEEENLVKAIPVLAAI